MKTQLLLFSIFFICLKSFSQVLDKKFVCTNGYVNAIAQNDSTVYIGGAFTQVGLSMAGIARFNAGSNTPDANFSKLSGNDRVDASESDGAGGVYLAGYFDNYDGHAIAHSAIIHVLSNDSLDHSFGPVTESTYYIRALKKKNNRLYLGGSFATVQGVSRPYLAAIDATTGNLLTGWVPDAPNNLLNKIEATDSLVFLQGYFTTIGGVAQPSSFATLSATTGRLNTLFPQAVGNISAIKADNNTLYFGGNIGAIGKYSKGLAVVADTNASTQYGKISFYRRTGVCNSS
jgi:hypothetical protein